MSNLPSLESEVVHVLFMDLVGFSTGSVDEQARLLADLHGALRATPEYRRAEAVNGLMALPTGDGMAIVFFRDPAAPARCALDLASELASRPRIKLRMGIHSGPVSRTEDINSRANVTGGGINLAQRVMDCGDSGHILVSGTSADILHQLGGWEDRLHYLGERKVKHGAQMRIHNLYTEDAGNPAVPAELQAVASTDSAQPAVTEQPATVGQVAVLYKRNSPTDGYVLKLLDSRLSAVGYRVFVDRHMSIGIEWATEIEKQIRASEAVLPILSELSVKSEMLECEIQIAHDAAQRQNGKPLILPIRLGHVGELPDSIASIVGPIQCAEWNGEEDDERIVAQVLDAIRRPTPLPDAETRARLEPVGGAVPLDSGFYIVRPADEEFRAAILRQDSIVLVKGPRQIGKTSLLARGLTTAREAGARVVLSDFQKLGAAHLESTETLFRTLAQSIADQLDLDVMLDAVWTERRSANANFERFLRREVLEKLGVYVVWAMDEVDRVFTCPFSSEVFGLFRSWHNERSLDPSGPWRHLTMAIAYATEAHLFITDLSQSPFNVGTRLTLEDFSLEHVADLNRLYGSPLRNAEEEVRFYKLVGGNPYLVRRSLHEMVAHGTRLDTLAAQADREDGPFSDHLKRILVLLAQDPALCEVVRGVLRGAPCQDSESFYRLRSAGLFAGDSAADARPRCRLYQTYLARHVL